MSKNTKKNNHITHLDEESLSWTTMVLRDLDIPGSPDWEDFFQHRVTVVPDELMEPEDYLASGVSTVWRYDLANDSAKINANVLEFKGDLFYRSLLEISAHRWAHLTYYDIASNYVIEDCDDDLELAHRRQEILDTLNSNLKKGHAKETTIADYLRHHPWEFHWSDPTVTFMLKSHKLARQKMTKEDL